MDEEHVSNKKLTIEEIRFLSKKGVFSWRWKFRSSRVPTVGEPLRLLLIYVGIILVAMAYFSTRTEKEDLKEWELMLGVVLVGIFGWKIVSFALRMWRAVYSPFQPFCPYCGKYIPSQIEWKCGYCDQRNRTTTLYGFLYKCEHCRSAPKAMQCHRCSRVIFLDTDGDDRHCATIWTAPALEESEDAIRAKWQRNRLQHEQALDLSRLATELANQKTEERLAKAKMDSATAKPKTERERQEAEFDREYDLQLARREIIERKKQEANAESNSELRERKLEVIAWMQENWGIE